ncbi:7-carboxy-7-deazaguanine synthase [Amycolatopsis saalfeldensis]|uniref:7-carboxy-7-deazaguanine synthase n=1 Tax=Amycolatopsis saalfeldensis TaxID=394193 RepID=UPI000B856982|nr:7-carboxy-7-deazaguanine synthase [Amycolatopsis saalfeldensis]
MGRRYLVKEVFYTLQGEGAHAGRPAVFCRFSLCNLWTGREEDRARAVCTFCDTDFVGQDGPGGGQFETASELADAVARKWPNDKNPRHHRERMVVLTGGEPLLQVDEALIKALKARGFYVAVETNGTIVPPLGLDWICVSPKARTQLQLTSGDELKLVYPQSDNHPADFAHLDFGIFSLQPLDTDDIDHIPGVLRYCLKHPQWRLSLQTHKIVGIS